MLHKELRTELVGASLEALYPPVMGGSESQRSRCGDFPANTFLFIYGFIGFDRRSHYVFGIRKVK